MAKLLSNSFTQFELTEDEELQGSLLTITQKQKLQNELAIAAETKLALEYDTHNPTEYVKQEAFFKGKIEIIRFLLDSSDQAANILENRPVPED